MKNSGAHSGSVGYGERHTGSGRKRIEMKIPYVMDNRQHLLSDVLNELLEEREDHCPDIAILIKTF